MNEQIFKICTRCGMCCNGGLFADGKLEAKDSPERLARLGMNIEEFEDETFFLQPCSAFDGCRCKIYNDRPTMCREFQCGVLQQVLAGKMEEPAAFSLIAEALECVSEVKRLLTACGENSWDLPLMDRFELVMEEPIDLEAGDECGDQRGELMEAMGSLMTLVESEFLNADAN